MKSNFHKSFIAVFRCILLVVLCGCAEEAGEREDALPSWNAESANKQAIIEFVEQVTDVNSASFVPVEQRIATFDMDGTIVAEKEIWLELRVALKRIEKELSTDVELVALKDKLLENLKTNPQPEDTGDVIAEVTGRAFEGMLQEEFVSYIQAFMQEEKEDFPGLKNSETFYKPMLELIEYLEENEFKVYLVSGSERGVVWGAAEQVVGLPRTQMIGSDITMTVEEKEPMYEPNDELVRGLDYTQSSVGNNKVYNIYRQIGIRPIFAAGNTDGDFSMLNYARSNPDYPGFALLLNHDDEEREYCYHQEERVKWDELAEEYGWHVVSMKNEFVQIFLKDS